MLTILVPVLLILFLATAAGISHVFTQNWTRSGEAIAKTVTLTGSGEINIDETVPGSSDIVLTMALDVSAVIGVYIVADGAVVLTVNDDGSPDKTITLAADIPVQWCSTNNQTSPLGSADWTSVKATKATATDASLKMRFLLDVSP